MTGVDHIQPLGDAVVLNAVPHRGDDQALPVGHYLERGAHIDVKDLQDGLVDDECRAVAVGGKGFYLDLS